jgi:hypothetical protein
MFALSTNNNHTKTPNIMNYSVSSLFAIAIAFFSFTASAAMNTAANSADANVCVQMDLTESVADGAITMSAAVLLPDGTTSRKTKTFRSMQSAVEGYVKFVSTLPYGSTLIRVQFTDEFGQVVFAAQG